MNLTTGNAHDADTHGTGWFIGFSEWALTSESELLYIPKDRPLTGLCVKWFQHFSGHESGDKPVSQGRTISILVSDDSAFRIEFSASAGFEADQVQTVLLQRHGDYVAWGDGLYHRWRCLRQATILTLRWNP